LLYTAQRRGDVIRMGRQHVREGFISVRQEKTGERLQLPLSAELACILERSANDHLTYLTTDKGEPYTVAGFGNAFRDWCRAAKLPPHCSAHGLRKAACRRLAEVGCTPHQIAAISGHKSLSEVQRYTKAADQKRLATEAMATLQAKMRTSIGKP
jgi:integrase